MDCLERFDKMFRILYILGSSIGIDMFKPMRANWRLVLCISVIIIGGVSALYTLWIVRDDFVAFLKCICALAQAVQGISKLYNFLTNKIHIEALLTFIRHIYLTNIKEGSPRRSKIIKKCTDKFVLLMKMTATICLIIIFIIGFYPIYSFVYLKQTELFFEIQLIGHPMSNKNMRTYISNYIAQFLELFYAYQGNNLYDIIFCSLVFFLYIFVELQQVAFWEMEELIGQDRRIFQNSLRNCLIMMQDINSYIMELNRIYSRVLLVQIGTGSVTFALGLFSIVKTDWLGAYGFGWLGFMQLIVYCLIGTYLELMNDRLVEIIYNFPWYLLSVRDQKLILITLAKAQRPTKMTIGGVAELNVSTGASIIKTIYSYLMLLLNFAE